MGTEKLLDLAAGIIEREWPCACPDAHLRSHCYVVDCPKHTLGPALVTMLTDAAASPVVVTEFMVNAALRASAAERAKTFHGGTYTQMHAAITAALTAQKDGS